MYTLIKVQETISSASYDRNKTCKQSNNPLHPLMGGLQPLEPRAHLPRSLHLRREQDEAIPSSRHVRKHKYGTETRERHKPFGGRPKTKEKILTAPSADREERIKLLLLNLNRIVDRTPNRTATGAGYILPRQNPTGGSASDFSMGQGASAIP